MRKTSSVTIHEMQSLMGSLEVAAQSILEHNEDVSTRLAYIGTKIAGSMQYATSAVESATEASDDASTTRPTKRTIPKGFQSMSGLGQSNAQLLKHTQQELEASRVYKRTAQRHSMSSIPSAMHSAAGWSMLSDLSLAQISSISVISLSISYDELWTI